MKVMKETAYILQKCILFHENAPQYEPLIKPALSLEYQNRYLNIECMVEEWV